MSIQTFTTETNEIAFRGQSIRIYVGQSNVENVLPLISINDEVTLQSNTNILCYISSIDTYGNSFLVTPYMPSDTIGLVGISTDVDVTIAD